MCASREVPLCDLSDEQLAVLVRDSSEEAFSLLVSRCTGMIQFLATAFRQSGVDAEDLAQEGLLGLLFAARTDAPGKAEIDPAQLVVQREDTQRLDNRLREILTSLEYEVLMLYFGAYTYEEIAQRLGIRTKAVDNALQRIRRKLASQPLLD